VGPFDYLSRQLEELEALIVELEERASTPHEHAALHRLGELRDDLRAQHEQLRAASDDVGRT
jgi:hypothetical protein